ncbi:MAG: ABC transporter permease, partial [Planctomycetes bacterium]|nr:ABC transporter permease [Planctomycetota bacterium]
RNLGRRPGRTAMTVLGIAFGTLLMILVEGMSAGLDRALSGSDAARTLIVYRQNRYCPQTSNLPERYTREIESVNGVTSVLPVKVYLSNCRASLDVVAFQGAPVERLLSARNLELIEGNLESFRLERDAALVGQEFAARRDLGVGDSFQFGEIGIKVAGIFRSAEPTEESVVLTHLEFLQRAGPVDRLGTVTQYEVKIDDPERAEAIAREIDQRFATAEEPTDTRAKAAFLKTATRDLSEVLRFARLLALGCVAVVLVLVGNTVLMAVVERMGEMGVLRTIGFHGWHLAATVLLEGVVYALAGFVLGLAGAYALISMTHLSIGAEGVSVSFLVTQGVVVRALVLSLGAAILAALIPAFQAARIPVVRALRGA